MTSLFLKIDVIVTVDDNHVGLLYKHIVRE